VGSLCRGAAAGIRQRRTVVPHGNASRVGAQLQADEAVRDDGEAPKAKGGGGGGGGGGGNGLRQDQPLQRRQLQQHRQQGRRLHSSICGAQSNDERDVHAVPRMRG
jgi:hypothetical protein